MENSHPEWNYDQTSWSDEERELAKGLKNTYICTQLDGDRELASIVGDVGIGYIKGFENPWEAVSISDASLVGVYATKEELLKDFPEFKE